VPGLSAPAPESRAGIAQKIKEFKMFAVIRSGGKQYSVKKDDVLTIGKIDGDEGAKVTFGEVMMLGGDKPTHGAPMISGASVAAEIVKQGRGEKVVAFKKKRRKNTHRKRGHRQHETTVKITGITAG
jgi:large subunit ribosomal protein L21